MGGGPGAASFYSPVHITFLGSTLLVCDSSNNRLRAIAPDGAVSTLSGGDASYRDGFGTSALFRTPVGITALPSGTVIIGDLDNNRLRQLTCMPCPAGYLCASGAPVACAAGSYCPLSATAPTLCPAGTFSSATGAASLSACTPCPSGTFSATPGAALSSACSPCAAGTFSTTLGANSSFACLPCAAGALSPRGATSCAFNATNCPVGTFANASAGACAPCSPATACTLPGLAAQPACYWNVSTLAGSGAAGWADGQGSAARFNNPVGVSLDPVTLSLYVGDHAGMRVRKVSPTGLVSTFAGSGSTAWADGLGTMASLCYPHDTSVDALGNVYVGDEANHRVRKILPTGLVSTLAGSGTAGAGNGIGTAAQLYSPTDIALDSSGTMGYIVEQTGSRIRSIKLSTAAVTTLAGSGSAGFADSAVGLSAQFYGPTAAAWHPSGLLYVADGHGNGASSNNRIRVINIATSAVSTLAGNGAAGGVDGVGTTATFFLPRGVTLDATLSVLYVTESLGHRLRSIALSSALVRTLAGSGTAGYRDGFGAAAHFNLPIFLISSPSGLYTADTGNNRIRQLICAPCPPGIDCSSGGPGQACAAGTFCPPGSSSAAPLACPSGSFCLPGASSPTPCPPGTYSAAVGGISLGLCITCPAGFYCPTVTVPASASASGMAYVTGASAPIPCTAAPGYGCLAGSYYTWGSICPIGYVCYGGGGWGSGGVGGVISYGSGGGGGGGSSGGGGSGGGSSGSGGGSGGPPVPCIVSSLCSTPGLTAVPAFTVATRPLTLSLGSSVTGALAAAAAGLGGSGDGGGAGGGSLLSPEDVAYDASGALAYITLAALQTATTL